MSYDLADGPFRVFGIDIEDAYEMAQRLYDLLKDAEEVADALTDIAEFMSELSDFVGGVADITSDIFAAVSYIPMDFASGK